MQINTRWIEPLAQHTGLPGEQIRQRLIAEPCFGIAAAGAIMRIYLAEERGDLMRAIGDYHSHTPALNTSYQARVLGAAQRLWPSAFSSTGRSAAAPPAGR